MKSDIERLAHTRWNCKNHIVFAPKYRRKVFYEEHRLEVREILRKLCEWKGVEIIEGEVCSDHVHILVSIPPKMSVSVFMGYLKGKSATIIFQKFGNMKFAWELCQNINGYKYIFVLFTCRLIYGCNMMHLNLSIQVYTDFNEMVSCQLRRGIGKCWITVFF